MFVLKPVAGMPNLRLFLVIVVTPTFMNALQVWVTDNFLKLNKNEVDEVD